MPVGDGVDERLILALQRVVGEEQRLTVRLTRERARAYVGNPNLNRP